MTTLTLELVQMLCPKGGIERNLSTIDVHIRAAAQRGVDFVCFPEMSITGYINPLTMPEAILRLDSEAVTRFVRMTAGHDVTAMAGIVEQNPAGKPFITQIVACRGEMLGYYRKKHVAPDEVTWFASSPTLPVFQHPQTTFAVALCADIDEPEIFRRYAEQGAKIVFEAAAPGLYGEQATRNWRTSFEWWRDGCRDKLGKYARDNRICIAVATQAGRTVDEDFPGGGYIFDQQGQCISASADWSPGSLVGQVAVT